jgi:hypothetical protein
VLTLNIAKKKCWNKSGDEHTATMSFVFIISTVGVSPRKQKATKAVATCPDCLPKLLAFNRPLTSRDAQVMDNSISDALEALTGRRTQLSIVHRSGAEPVQADKFKQYVHERLDSMGIPHSNPDSEHDKAGCRIGGRLDIVEQRISKESASLKTALSVVGKHAASVRWGKRKETKHGGSKS